MSGLVALRVVVAICLVALVWAVLAFLHQQYADRSVDGILGGLMAVYCLGRARGPPRRPRGDEPEQRRRSRGSHAA